MSDASGGSAPARSRLARAGRWLLRAAPRALGLSFAALLAGAMLLATAIAVAWPNLPEIDSLTDYRPRLPLRIYSADGVLVGQFGQERRHFTPIEQIPPLLRQAVLATEDASFYEHGGVHYVGVLRAAVANLHRSRSQGASTITMQVARNFYLPTKKTFTRKFYEMLLALKIEHLLGKDEIFEIYLNQIYLGQRAHGFAAASGIYFGKPLDALTIAETAMLAGCPQSPTYGNPIANPAHAKRRQKHVLDRMLRLEIITEAEHREALAQQLVYRERPAVGPEAAYAAETARQIVVDHFGEDAYTRGLNVTLSLSAADQAAAYHAVRGALLDFARRQPWAGPAAHVVLPGDAAKLNAAIDHALADHPDSDSLRAGVVLDASPQQLVAALRDGERATVRGAGLAVAAAALDGKGEARLQIRRGSVLWLLQGEDGEWAVAQMPEVQGAFVALDARTGAVRAMVGGFDHQRSAFNRALQAWRQPGSTIKPFIYSAALERGLMPSSVVDDAPVTIEASGGGEAWQPQNSDGHFDGPMSLRRALAKSKNTVAVKLLQMIGPVPARQWLTRFGLDAGRHPANLAMALGSGATTPMQLAGAYAVFANGGHRVEPQLITRITDARGKVIKQAPPLPVNESVRTLDARNAFVMDSLLGEVTRTGSARRASDALGRDDLHGKTGTTNDAFDAWFAGYQRDLVAVAWIGYDTPRKLGEHASGGGLALPVWIDFMRHALANVPPDRPTPPDGVVALQGEWYYEEFVPGSVSPALTSPATIIPAAPLPVALEDERKSILDLFR